MGAVLDETHDPARRSWVESAEGHPEFPLQNLPLGVFGPPGAPPRGGVAIGEKILDLRAAAASGWLQGEAQAAAEAGSGASLNPLLALGAAPRRALRRALFALLEHGAPEQAPKQAIVAGWLHDASACAMQMPATIGDYTDFYSGIRHARNVGRLFRPDNPLPPNYKHVPIGYHGRASSVRPSGEPVRRPLGQAKAPDAAGPSFGPTRRLDYELEIGLWIGPGNRLGQPIPISHAGDHVAGLCLLNDWSARDVQAWEAQPLGPFLAKSFHTTISPWIVTTEALAPFAAPQSPRPEGDPQALPYLLDPRDQASGAWDITLDVFLQTERMRREGLAPHRLSRGSTRAMYWTAAQLLAHHTSNGCNLRPGDLFGSGTLSGEPSDSWGSLLELTRGGAQPLALPGGEARGFLEDGDELTLRAVAAREGRVSIGFGACSGRIAPAP